MALFGGSSWYYFDAWLWKGNGWSRVYSRGPMYLGDSAANNEYLDTFDSYPGGLARMFKWTGSSWAQIH